MTDASISNCERLIEGTPYLLAEQLGDFLVGDEAEPDEADADLAAVRLLMVQASCSWAGVMRFSLSSSSPIRTAIVVRPCGGERSQPAAGVTACASDVSTQGTDAAGGEISLHW